MLLSRSILRPYRARRHGSSVPRVETLGSILLSLRDKEVDVSAVLLIDRDREDAAFDFAQFNETVFPIIQVDTVIRGDS